MERLEETYATRAEEVFKAPFVTLKGLFRLKSTKTVDGAEVEYVPVETQLQTWVNTGVTLLVGHMIGSTLASKGINDAGSYSRWYATKNKLLFPFSPKPRGRVAPRLS